MQIDIPSAERNELKESIPELFAPEYTLFVFDESMFETRWTPSDPEFSNNNRSWYFNAVCAFSAWDISTGSEDITVAVVDNGFNLNHKEFKNKVVMPYNVWNHDKKITCQKVDHGSHVAATAIGLADNSVGLCGIAPKCKFMPVQVADENGMMTTTSVLDGIIYSIYQGAKVVNVSIGTSLTGFNQIPENVQRNMIYNNFKEEERLWTEISRIANAHNTTIVVAAGNDNVLAGIEALQRPETFIVVSALDKQNRHYRKTNFSNYGEYSTISAPGIDIYSAYGKGFKSLDGTSMSAPIVTGAVALMKSLNKNLTNQQIRCILISTAKSVDEKIGPMLQIDKALLKVKNNEIDDCSSNVPEVTPSHGDVEITLHWDNTNDLDLACVDPFGEMIMFNHRHSGSGGELQIDMNYSSDNLTQTPVEHIYWPTGSAPSGTYQVFVTHYRRFDASDNSSFTLDVKYGQQQNRYTGVISSSDGRRAICTFTLNDNGTGSSAESSQGTGSRIDVPGSTSGGSNNNSNVNSRRRELLEKRDRLQHEIDEIDRNLRNL